LFLLPSPPGRGVGGESETRRPRTGVGGESETRRPGRGSGARAKLGDLGDGSGARAKNETCMKCLEAGGTQTRMKERNKKKEEETSGIQSPQFRGGFLFSGLLGNVRQLRKRQTPAEKIFWNEVRNRKFYNLKFRRQHQIGFYIVDFYCHEYNLVIELDGSIHDLETNKKNDEEREWNLKFQGYKILRFPNERIFNDIDAVLKEIFQHISLLPSPPGRRVGDEGEERSL
jgi:very-short-patch-repair endonuclease